MKPQPPASTRAFSLARRRTQPRGAALIFVLSALALIAFLVLMIMAFVRSEDRASRTAADLIEVRTLAELPEKLVIAQIRDATSQLGASFTWASQPGMIRRYSDQATTGNPRATASDYYKLYSATEMHLDQRGDPAAVFKAEADAFKQWNSSRAAFTDLNQPVVVSPRRRQGSNAPTTQSTLLFPILHPEALTRLGIDGFEVAADISAPTNPLPMPAQWLYVLRDGSIAAPNSANGDVITIPGATEQNPIVGRIAFWTDDETCKLNLNTATEPAPWRTPHTHTRSDVARTESQPVQGEHYRDPSHPAFTSLAPVLRHFGTGNGVNSGKDPEREPAERTGGNAATWWQHLKKQHVRLPRTFVDQGSSGSDGGTRDTSSLTGSDMVRTKRQPLIPSVEEFFFDPQRQPVGSQASQLPLKIEQDDLRAASFFLTTRSRAPELNPFNRPKISLWPVQESTTERNTTDQALVALSTLSNSAYYFQRASAWSSGNPGSSQSSTADLGVQRNIEILGNLQVLFERDIPGFGGSFVSKYGSGGSNQLLTSSFDFIRTQANIASPQSAITPLPQGSDYFFLPPGYQLGGNSSGTAEYSAVPINGGTQLPGAENPPSSGQRPPTQGFGRFPTVTEVALVFVATAAETEVSGGSERIKNTDGYPEWADRTTRIDTFVLLQPFIVAPGSPATSPSVCYRIRGLDQLQLENQPLGLPADTPGSLAAFNRAAFSSSAPLGASSSGWGGHASAYAVFGQQFLTPNGAAKHPGPTTPGSLDPDLDFPFYGQMGADLPNGKGLAGTTLAFNGGFITIDIFPAAGGVPTANIPPVQSIQVELPTGNFPTPLLPVAPDGSAVPRPNMQQRFTPQTSSAGASLTLILRGDVVRSVALQGDDRGTDLSLTRGDTRLLAAAAQPLPAVADPASNPNNLPSVPAVIGPVGGPFLRYLAKHPLYDQADPPPAPGAPMPASFEAHHLRDGATTATQPGIAPMPADTALRAGNLALRTNQVGTPGASVTANVLDYTAADSLGNTAPATPPDLSLGALNLDQRPGDFDNGPGLIEDGPYINKPDQGNGLTAGHYFTRGSNFALENGPTYNPARSLSSAIGFGSLPSGLQGFTGNSRPRPWQTLLFCPHPASRTTPVDEEPGYTFTPTGGSSDKYDHVGFGSPRDHLLAEFFWLPKTDPPGLCEGFATEGKVNMNYQLMPYTWITRATALHGALHGVRLTAIPSRAATAVGSSSHYKNSTAAAALQFDYSINARATCEGFQARFAQGDIFRSPSEICEMWLVPQRLPTSGGHNYTGGGISPQHPNPTGKENQLDGLRYTDMLTWWEGTSPSDPTDGFEATGDNLRESPYAQLYPRLTTRSNTFTVHYRVQTLRKSRSVAPNQWDEDKDNVGAEYRGSTTIERYLDPTEQNAPDFSGSSFNGGRALDDFYHWRVVRRTQFAP